MQTGEGPENKIKQTDAHDNSRIAKTVKTFFFKIPICIILIAMAKHKKRPRGRRALQSPQCHSKNWHGGWASKLSFSDPLPSVRPHIPNHPPAGHQLSIHVGLCHGTGKVDSDLIMQEAIKMILFGYNSTSESLYYHHGLQRRFPN